MTKSGLLSLGLLALAQSCAILHAKPVDVTLADGDVLRVEAVTPNILRVRLAADGRFQRSLMERYGIVKSEWPTADFKTRSEGGSVIVETTAGSLSVRAADGRMQLRNSAGAVLCERILPQGTRWRAPELEAFKKRQASLEEYFRGEKRQQGQVQIIGSAAQDKAAQPDVMHEFFLPTNSFGATFSLRGDERLYGLGTASSKRLQLRGHGYRLWTQYRGNFGYHGQGAWEQTEGPIPLLLSTGGWGIFVNTTWVHYYDLGRYEADRGFFWGPGGSLDFYLLLGDSLPRLIGLYTEITGRPRLMPQLVWMLNYGMSGHMNTSCDMETRGQGLHFGFLQPWSQHNNWAYANQPWFLGKRAEAMFRDYARLSDYTLYEDDGNSLAYLSGAVAVTRVRCEAGPVAVTLTIEPRQGTYARMPLQRDYEVWIHSRPAKKLAINGTQAAADYDPVAKATRIAVQEDAGRKAAIHLQCEF
jgi:hypothetical protein